jgi:hypothetical protein
MKSGPLSCANETLESLGLMLLGVVTLFTEEIERDWHSHRNQEHWIVGVVMLFGGFAGLAVQWVVRRVAQTDAGQSDKAPIRNILPPLSFAIVGLVLSQHTSQFTSFSATLHSTFGNLLMLASVIRILALAPFLLYLEHLAAFLILCAGLVLISSYDEWVDLLLVAGIDRFAYLAAVSAFALLLVGWTWFWAGMWMRGPSQEITSETAAQDGYAAIGTPDGNGANAGFHEVDKGIFGGDEEADLDMENVAMGLQTLGGRKFVEDM